MVSKAATGPVDNEGIVCALVAACPFCSAPGALVQDGLRDELFAAPGTWELRRCEDGSCGLVWLTPVPLPSELHKVYRTYYTHESERPTDSFARSAFGAVVDSYLGRRYGAHTKRNRLLGRLLYLHPGRRADADYRAMFIPVRPGGRLLDVGCGAGQVLSGLEELGWRAQGLDVDPLAVEEARRSGLHAEVGTLEDQSFPDATFDAVISSHVVEHVGDPRALLREMHRVLAPSGTCVIVTPNFDSWGRRRYGRHWRGLEPPRHLSVFHSALLEKMARDAGFERVQVRSTIRGAHEYFSGSIALGRSIGTPTAPIRWWSRGLQLVEWLVLKVRPDRGEELVLIARKSDGTLAERVERNAVYPYRPTALGHDLQDQDRALGGRGAGQGQRDERRRPPGCPIEVDRPQTDDVVAGAKQGPQRAAPRTSLDHHGEVTRLLQVT
jgi:2-polyprenyl-3-methyl-5-hydroxy-6-metoxy-1,4-benzoquinol methylase